MLKRVTIFLLIILGLSSVLFAQVFSVFIELSHPHVTYFTGDVEYEFQKYKAEYPNNKFK